MKKEEVVLSDLRDLLFGEAYLRVIDSLFFFSKRGCVIPFLCLISVVVCCL